MDEVKVNFATKSLPERKARRLFFFGRAAALVIAILAIGASVVSYRLSFAKDNETILDELPVFSQIRSMIRVAERVTEDDGRTNILITGVGGPGHEGPQLTDTMLFLTLDRAQKRAAMFSVPRDLFVDIPGYGENKINHANAYGEEKGFGEGPKLASEVVANVFGKPIHFYIRVDFAAFQKVIDEIGGIDVAVERSFVDEQFPTDDFLTQTIAFEAGRQHMDGVTALNLARSRHGSNGEGSDFARSKRQQKIIAAVREKLLSSGVLTSPTTISNLLRLAKSHVSTNLTPIDIIGLAKDYRGLNMNEIQNIVLVPGEQSPLYETYVGNSYAILPKVEDWSEIHALANDVFKNPIATTKPTETLSITMVEVQNGTKVTGLARATAAKIAKQGFTVAKIGNAAKIGFDKTVIYDLSKGKKQAELKKLATLLQAEVKVPENGWIYTPAVEVTPVDLATDSPKEAILPDFLVIIGAPSQLSVR